VSGNEQESVFSKTSVNCLIVSDYNLVNLSTYLNRVDFSGPAFHSRVCAFGQAVPTLINTSADPWDPDLDAVIVWTQPEKVSPTFQELLDCRHVSPDALLQEVDNFCSLLRKIPEHIPMILVPSWVAPPYHRGLGVLLEMHPDLGITGILARMNLRLTQNFAGDRRIFVLDSHKWIQAAGRKAFNPTLWYAAKVPFSNEVLQEAARDMKGAVQAIGGNSRKLLVLDLDDTLWGGAVGELGWQKIKLGGHDPVGEAYVDFQRVLKSLLNRGILLAIVSKNQESVALAALENHPEMVLRPADFAGWRINWRDKAENIVELVSELNLGLQSVVFIDDSPVERARVAEALPEVLVPQWPESPLFYPASLHDLRCFDTPSLTEEDRKRAQMYASERRRKADVRAFTSLDEWLKTLMIRIEVEELSLENLDRAVQLLNRTNQMNLATRRLSPSQLRDWAGEQNRKMWTLRVRDKLGDSGLSGVVSLEIHDDCAVISDFVLSCRVIGRKVEEAMLATAIDYCKSRGLNEVTAGYIPTPKNGPCLVFFRNSGFEETATHVFRWSLNKPYPVPEYIQVTMNDRAPRLQNSL
jgi:FkbH-like protein